MQWFFNDQFNSVKDPREAAPIIMSGQTIIPSPIQGIPPFYLQCEEWAAQNAPFPENYYDLSLVFNPEVNPHTVTLPPGPWHASWEFSGWSVKKWLADAKDTSNEQIGFFRDAYAVKESILLALEKIRQSELPAALESLQTACDKLSWVLSASYDDSSNYTTVNGAKIVSTLATRIAISVTTRADLPALLNFYNLPEDRATPDTMTDWMKDNFNLLISGFYVARLFVLPLLMADIYVQMGDLANAVGCLYSPSKILVGRGTLADTRSYCNLSRTDFLEDWRPALWTTGDLPNGTDTSDRESYLTFYMDRGEYVQEFPGMPARDFYKNSLHPVDRAFAKLQCGKTLLRWADNLYRQDTTSGKARARELYKAVMFLHGDVPPISPNWDQIPTPQPDFSSANPQLAAQVAAARLGFLQIAANLNYFGYSQDLVPSLRYSTLKQAADAFAAEAKATEIDFVTAISRVESLTVSELMTSTMIQKGSTQAKLVDQQKAIANDQLKQANLKVDQVNEAITDLQQEIEDHDSFFGQFSDWFTGFKDLVSDSFDWANEESGSIATAMTAEQSSSASASSQGGLAMMGTGASVVAGYGAFFVATEIVGSNLADAANKRTERLNNLKYRELPSALAQKDIAQRNVTIADLNKQIIDADISLYQTLLKIQQTQYLNLSFWTRMIGLYRQILQQTLESATRTAWLAERALEYELNLDLNVMRLDYYNSSANAQGVGGADQLQMDLATLQSRYIENTQETMPAKWTISLARDFPLEFATLRSTGKCSVYTKEDTLRQMYPGTYAYRILSVKAVTNQLKPETLMRGIVTNNGNSQISDSDGNYRSLVRATDVLLISEFNIETTADMNIYGLPGKTLMQFEGSGIETVWNVEFTDAGAPSGFNKLADFLITFDMQARFSADLYSANRTASKAVSASSPSSSSGYSKNQAMVISARKQRSQALSLLRTNAEVTEASIAWKFPALRKGLSKRAINNVAIAVVGENDSLQAALATLKATVELSCSTSPTPPPTPIPAWTATRSYLKGDKTVFNGHLYECIRQHTPAPDWTPVDAASLWTDLGLYSGDSNTTGTMSPAQSISITFHNNVVISTNPPLTDAKSTVAKSALDVLAGGDPALLSLRIKKEENGNLAWGGVKDVLLWVDCIES